MDQTLTRCRARDRAHPTSFADTIPHWLHHSVVRFAELVVRCPPDDDVDVALGADRLVRHARSAGLSPDRAFRLVTHVLDGAWGTHGWPPRHDEPGSASERRNRVAVLAITAYYAAD